MPSSGALRGIAMKARECLQGGVESDSGAAKRYDKRKVWWGYARGIVAALASSARVLELF